MTDKLDLDIDTGRGDGHNVTDWCLREFQARYGEHVTKDDIFDYMYGVMHAPDWRERYRHDLQRNLPRVPLADDFGAFRDAGRKLMDLHIGYETVEEWPVECQVKGEPDEGQANPDAYRIRKAMRWGKDPEKPKKVDRSVLKINSQCSLVGIPEEAHKYTVSGRSPLEWAVASLKHKTDKASKITDDPNGWHVWADDEDAFELIRHLRRLVRVSVETARIVEALPPSL